MTKKLARVTLFGLDCVEISRLIQVAEICQKDFEFEKVKLLTSLESNHSNIVKIDPINTIEAYNQFMIKKMNDYIDTDFVLVIQYDGFILNPEAWTDEYLKYDYIGAPWHKDGHFIVGNGGFSLRSKKLLEILQKDDSLQIPADEPEDTFICQEKREHLESKGIKFAPVDLARQFALEANEKDGVEWTNQFGFHGLKWTDISKWLKEHPEYKIDNPLDSWALGVKERFKSNE
ncbi:MAG: hypothetical protein A3C61_01565 [Candidatus Yanofskybacteria bacterium RIFCSPHIGHO2_02_FULL_39_10]|uniref:DUF5672 domain-containing protein n=1 Tax=Candidatus Yanofskybacteria bacterium RIFCSPHIGHO2_02_FULL_39_10 TaxID=1802674 RepID=A0A1F8F845_9BACT|nr:MAG: hypothetical protein A3C61_01565 [Candidatus Yanofskybacteria bacterium RIFCSPHIGHO2_02_FULL_39_10]